MISIFTFNTFFCHLITISFGQLTQLTLSPTFSPFFADLFGFMNNADKLWDSARNSYETDFCFSIVIAEFTNFAYLFHFVFVPHVVLIAISLQSADLMNLA